MVWRVGWYERCRKAILTFQSVLKVFLLAPPEMQVGKMMPPFPDNLTAILFSGGDAPGMNALLRAVVRLGTNRYQLPILGIRDGYQGLVHTARRLESGELTIEQLKGQILERQGDAGLIQQDQDLVLMTNSAVTGSVVEGGILLRSARCREFQYKPEVREMVYQMLRDLGVRNLIVCGGDGSLKGARCLLNEGKFRVMGVPGTIDNDLPVTDMALGVHTAVATVVWAVDHVKDTARSHKRVMVIETMGRDSGELTQLAAIASGAEFAIVPEEGKVSSDKIRAIAQGIERDFSRGRTHTIILVAEGVKFEPESEPEVFPARRLKRDLEEYFQPADPLGDAPVDIRHNVLGHMQRGGRPDPADSILAARFAECALEGICASREQGGIVVQRAGEVTRVSFDELETPRNTHRPKHLSSLQAALSGWD
jgi:6-phosphofructokinase 1